jgi:hypothetical protein
VAPSRSLKGSKGPGTSHTAAAALTSNPGTRFGGGGLGGIKRGVLCGLLAVALGVFAQYWPVKGAFWNVVGALALAADVRLRAFALCLNVAHETRHIRIVVAFLVRACVLRYAGGGWGEGGPVHVR